MKKTDDYLGNGIIVELSEPKFKEVRVTGIVTTRYPDGREDPSEEYPEGKPIYRYETGPEERIITLCQISGTISEFLSYASTIGVAIRNPEDTDNELGKVIAEGRAIKNPIGCVQLISLRKLPKPIIEEQFIWAEKHVERNLDKYVNNLRETLKK